MKVVLLAGGLGTRISEETGIKPKPMIEIGGRPLLWHVMKIYSYFGHNDFIVCLGYKGYVIKEYFANYFLHMSDVTVHVAENRLEVHRETAEPWKITLVDTGEATMTGGRIKRILPYVANDDVFALTYGDGLSDIDINKELAFHRAHRKLATLAGVRPTQRFGMLGLDGDRVTRFEEKPVEQSGGRINAGFFLLSPAVGDLIEGDKTVWERGPLEALAIRDQLRAYQHDGFWYAMDTLRDKTYLEQEWASGKAPWKLW